MLISNIYSYILGNFYYNILYKKLKYNSNYDSLTGIFNRGKVIENINLYLIENH